MRVNGGTQDHQFHHVFFFGDLNYRLDCTMSQEMELKPWSEVSRPTRICMWFVCIYFYVCVFIIGIGVSVDVSVVDWEQP